MFSNNRLSTDRAKLGGGKKSLSTVPRPVKPNDSQKFLVKFALAASATLALFNLIIVIKVQRREYGGRTLVR